MCAKYSPQTRRAQGPSAAAPSAGAGGPRARHVFFLLKLGGCGTSSDTRKSQRLGTQCLSTCPALWLSALGLLWFSASSSAGVEQSYLPYASHKLVLRTDPSSPLPAVPILHNIAGNDLKTNGTFSDDDF